MFNNVMYVETLTMTDAIKWFTTSTNKKYNCVYE
jgi:hypothetical protein